MQVLFILLKAMKATIKIFIRIIQFVIKLTVGIAAEINVYKRFGAKELPIVRMYIAGDYQIPAKVYKASG